MLSQPICCTLEVVGLPTAVTTKRKPAMTPITACCVSSTAVPLTMHLIDPLWTQNAVCSQFLGSAKFGNFFSFPFLPSSYWSCLFLLFLSIFFFDPIIFRFLAFFSFLFFYWAYFLCLILFRINMRLSCVCVVIDTTCNIFVVVFLGWQAVYIVVFSRRE